MTAPPDPASERSYGCSFGCGRPYDYVIVQVSDGTTEFVCTPCFLVVAGTIVKAMTEPDDPEVAFALAHADPLDTAPMDGTQPKRGRRNAPATADDPAIFAAYDDVISVDELPEEFR